MRLSNRTAILTPLVTAILLAAACTHYRGPRGPEADAFFELYNGDWVLDADASDPAPGLSSPLAIFPVSVTSVSGGGGPTLDPPCPRGRICVDRPRSSGETRRSESSGSVPDSALLNAYDELATHRPSHLTLLVTRSGIRVSPSGLGASLEVPMDGAKTEVDHELGDFSVKAWSRWEGESPSLVISVGEDRFRVSDTYELQGDGTLVVTRELGGGYSFWPNETPRLVYRRPDTPLALTRPPPRIDHPPGV